MCRRCFRVVVRGPGRRYVSLSDYPSWPQVLSLFPHVVQYDRRYFRFVVRGHGRKHVAVIWDVAVSSYPSWSHVLSFFFSGGIEVGPSLLAFCITWFWPQALGLLLQVVRFRWGTTLSRYPSYVATRSEIVPQPRPAHVQRILI